MIPKSNIPVTSIEFGQLIFRKIVETVTIRRHILWLKFTKFDFGWSSEPDPAGRAHSAGFKGSNFWGKGRTEAGEERKRKGKGKTGGRGFSSMVVLAALTGLSPVYYSAAHYQFLRLILDKNSRMRINTFRSVWATSCKASITASIKSPLIYFNRKSKYNTTSVSVKRGLRVFTLKI